MVVGPGKWLDKQTAVTIPHSCLALDARRGLKKIGRASRVVVFELARGLRGLITSRYQQISI